MQDVYAAIVEVLSHGGRAAVATIVRATGSTPQRVGAKMLVREDGSQVGTIGGGCYESDAFLRARRAIESGRAELAHYELNDDVAEENGLICGGRMDVFIEPISPAPELFVIGAGHVGAQLAALSPGAGFRTHVVDDREKFASADRFPDAASVTAQPLPEWLESATLPRGAYVVVVTRGHRHDLDALRQLIQRDLAYLGLIGSRAKVARLYEVLQEEGVSAERLRRVHAPIGLDIGAVTPEEIAVSILAELIAVRRGRLGHTGEGRPDSTPRSLQWAPPSVTEPTSASRS
jgi:xanthine dehydrogenase accessory factor